MKQGPAGGLFERRTLGTYVASIDNDGWFSLHDPDEDRAYCLTKRFAEFLYQTAVCKECGDSLREDLSGCRSGHGVEGPLRLVIPNSSITAFEREMRTAKKANRNAKRCEQLEYNGGEATNGELQQVWQSQEACCLYCGEPLDDGGGDPTFHIDHFRPVVAEGGGEIENLVFACPECNNEKGDEGGNQFRARKRQELTEERRRVVLRIWRRRLAWLRRKDEAWSRSGSELVRVKTPSRPPSGTPFS